MIRRVLQAQAHLVAASQSSGGEVTGRASNQSCERAIGEGAPAFDQGQGVLSSRSKMEDRSDHVHQPLPPCARLPVGGSKRSEPPDRSASNFSDDFAAFTTLPPPRLS